MHRQRYMNLADSGWCLGLTGWSELLRQSLGDPQDDLKVIHVAGTNGKGSVSKYLEEGLSACGYKMGLYTSPLYRERSTSGSGMTERIFPTRIWNTTDRRWLSAAEAMVADGHGFSHGIRGGDGHRFPVFCGQAGGYHDPGSGAWRHRRFHQCGEEARWQASSRSISYDHMAQTGQHAWQRSRSDKAGIIKTGCPVIANVPQRDAAKIIARKAYAMGSRLYDVSGIRAAVSDETPFSQKVSMELYEKSYSDVEISMVGQSSGGKSENGAGNIGDPAQVRCSQAGPRSPV